MTAGISRFAGWAAAFAAGVLLPAPFAGAQAGARDAGFPNPALHSAVSGVVRDRSGRAQVGVAIELLNARYAVVARTFTDDRGRYSLPRLGSGLYQIKATSELLLPAIHTDLRLVANVKAVVNLTLVSVYQALDWLPAEPRLANSPADEWDWTLRLSTNRPLLRMLPPEPARQAGISGPVVLEHSDSPSTAARAFSGVRGFGQGGWSQQFSWRSMGEGARAFALSARAGQARIGGTAAYRQELAPDRTLTTTVSYTERPAIRGGAGSGLQIARVRSSSTVRAGDLAELSAGTELAAARLGGAPVAAVSHPFANLCVHGGAIQVEYRLATVPTAFSVRQQENNAEEDAPGLAAEGGRLRFTEGLHQELRATSRVGSWTGEVAGFEDRLAHPVVQGVLSRHAPGDEAAVDSKDVLFDPETGIIAVSGRGYSHGGVMALLRDQLSPDTWLSLRFALGEAVTAPASGSGLPVFGARETPAASIGAGTRLPGSGTLVRGSYRWQPLSTLTAVTPFEAGTPDAYLGFSVRQPLPLRRTAARGEGGAARVEAVLDVRNLLAQGYRPFLSEDGSTVFFAQAQRTIAGGVSFSF